MPLPNEPVPTTVASLPFVWSQDSVWTSLENQFLAARAEGCAVAGPLADEKLDAINGLLDELSTTTVSPGDAVWASIEDLLFKAGAQVAACPSRAERFVATAGRVRSSAKQQSIGWDIESVEARRRLYRLLYGGRAAVEEVLSQTDNENLALARGSDEPSAAPSAVVHGVRIHSGDLLVSRGGYPTSALISRGSDYPGNFSHVAIAHVSEAGEVSVVEAHIEVGVAIASAEKYLQDKKLRLMVLRIRNDLPAVVADPMLAHKAAEYALQRAQTGHVPYDFEMDYQDPAKLFCSEVASDAYNKMGVTLWTGISTISTPGLRSWLSAFGVRHFETQEPSDLEYDPQLVVVAEWRDPATLRMDRVDNAVVDALLETAENGAELGFPWYQLAPARLAKGYSVFQNQLGNTGPIPEGMSSASALKNTAYTKRHDQLSAVVSAEVDSIAVELGYAPPYWRILDTSRQVVAAAGN